MSELRRKWLYLLILSLIWGSSFILIKKALLGFTPLQLGGSRIVIASAFLFMLGFKSMKEITSRDWKWILLAGFLSSFFPPFFFALAQTEIESGVTSIFNSLAPLFTAMVGIALFGTEVTRRQLLGIFVGLAGTALLLVAGIRLHPGQNHLYAFFILLSAFGYAFNINIIKKHLRHLSPLAITTASFGVVILPAAAILLFTGMGQVSWDNDISRYALVSVLILAIAGTGFANIVFNQLIKISSPVYAASVTYVIPLVAVLWGLWDGERISAVQLAGGGVILFGVYLVNRRRPAEKRGQGKA